MPWNAAASFHGGRLAVTGDPSSSHLSADRITATVYIAGATDDESYTTEQAELLQSALTVSGVDHTVEFYPARHWEALHLLYRAHLTGVNEVPDWALREDPGAGSASARMAVAP